MSRWIVLSWKGQSWNFSVYWRASSGDIYLLKQYPIYSELLRFFCQPTYTERKELSLLFSKNGFVNTSPCEAVASLGIPVFTHKSDFIIGLATRLNLRFVRKTDGRIFIMYENTAKFLAKSRLSKERVIVSGNPVHPVFRSADPAKVPRAFIGLGQDERLLLVLGGSHGARELNILVRGTISDLRRHYTVMCQYGSAQDWDMPKKQRYPASIHI